MHPTNETSSSGVRLPPQPSRFQYVLQCLNWKNTIETTHISKAMLPHLFHHLQYVWQSQTCKTQWNQCAGTLQKQSWRSICKAFSTLISHLHPFLSRSLPPLILSKTLRKTSSCATCQGGAMRPRTLLLEFPVEANRMFTLEETDLKNFSSFARRFSVWRCQARFEDPRVIEAAYSEKEPDRVFNEDPVYRGLSDFWPSCGGVQA